jgi:hypothetical protein
MRRVDLINVWQRKSAVPKMGASRNGAPLIERADHDEVTIWIPEPKLSRSCRWVQVRLLVESRDKSASSHQGHVEVIDAEKQE